MWYSSRKNKYILYNYIAEVEVGINSIYMYKFSGFWKGAAKVFLYV